MHIKYVRNKYIATYSKKHGAKVIRLLGTKSSATRLQIHRWYKYESDSREVFALMKC